MKRGILLAIFLIFLVIALTTFFGYSKDRVPEYCGEKEVILEGKLVQIMDKYEISAIETKEGTFWFYGGPKGFFDNINKTVVVKGILSPGSEDPKCNVCLRESDGQCPYSSLLYDTEIIEIK